MITNTIELNKLSDEQVEKELKDLRGKQDVTAEEKEKLEILKEERQSRLDKRIKMKDSERLAAINRAEQLEKQLEEERKKREELESKNKTVSIVNDTVEFDGRKFYTDKALRSMVDAGELTAEEAYEHQQERIEAKVTERVIKRNIGNTKEEEERKTRAEDAEKIARDYPQFNPKHPDHDPEDPLFKKANELWMEGYHANPRGLSKAIERAKEILGYTKERPDLSDEFSVARSKSTVDRSAPSTVALTADEKDFYVRMYVMGNIINPKTNKTYTESEAIAKGLAMKAKNARK